jgi:hypothetical protein
MTTTMAPNETLDRRSAVRIGTIVIARHGKPHAERTVRIDHHGYREWWAGYDLAGVCTRMSVRQKNCVRSPKRAT